MRNTYMLNGPHTPEEIIASVKKGLYAEKFSNGQVNIGAGDFTFYLKHGRLIENGKLTARVKDANLIGNGPKVLERSTWSPTTWRMDRGGGSCGKDGQSVPVGFGLPTVKCGGHHGRREALMSTVLLERAKAAVAAARKRGAQGVRASASALARVDRRVARRQARPPPRVDPALAQRHALRRRALLENSTPDLRPDALARSSRRSVARDAAARRGSAPPPARSGALRRRLTADLQLEDPARGGRDAAGGGVEQARALEEAVRAGSGAERIISVTTWAGDTTTESGCVTTNGLAAERRHTSAIHGVEVAVTRRGRPQAVRLRLRRRALPRRPAADRRGRPPRGWRARWRSSAPRKRRPAATVVIENRVVPRLLTHLLRALQGDAVQQRRSFLEQWLRQERWGSKVLTFTDDLAHRSQCAVISISLCSVSTPSATTFSPSLCAITIMASDKARSFGSVARSRTKERSILR